MEQLTYTIQQACEVSGIDRQLLLRLCRAGEVPGARKVGRRWFLPRRAFETWLGVAEAEGEGVNEQ